jgi:hypothetical protein
MSMSRRFWFLVMILAGLGLGLLYGWVINPVKYIDTSPDSLRSDYKADYILMVAEAYRAEGDPALAARRLAFLGSTPPLEMAQQAVLYAGTAKYPPSDVDLLIRLVQALQSWNAEATPVNP